MEKGTFIVIEGPDACGKSTHARLLGEHLESKGRDTIVTQEPTKGPIGQVVREVLSGRLKVSPETLTLLFTADRAEHVENLIEPALRQGKTVVTDRYYYSTVVYQSLQGVDKEWISQLNAFVPEPDLVVVLEVASKEALNRMEGRTREVFEVVRFQKRVQKALLKLAHGGSAELSRPGRAWEVVSSSGEVGKVQARIRKAVEGHLQ